MNKHDDNFTKNLLCYLDFSQDNPNFKKIMRMKLEKYVQKLSDEELDLVSAAGDPDVLDWNLKDAPEN